MRTGYDVVVRPLPAGADPGALADLIARLPEHVHLLRPVMSADASGRPLLVTRLAPHLGLDELVRRRGGLAPAEVVGVGLAVGRGLAALHSAGLVHGGVSTTSVVVGAEARPLLDATSMLALEAPTTQPGDDVVALAELLSGVVEAPVPPAMTEILLAAAERDPELPATELVRRLVAACPPEPLRLVARPVATVARPKLARRRLRRPRPRPLSSGVRRGIVVGLCVVAAVLAAVLAGIGWERVSDREPAAARVPTPVPTPLASITSTAAPTTARPSASPAAVDWAGLLAQLDDRREEAFTQGDLAALTDVDAPGSAVLAEDTAALDALSAAAVHASGFRQVLARRIPCRSPRRGSCLQVVDERPAYALVRATDGSVVADRPARGEQSWRVELVLGDAGWQFAAVRPG